MKITSSYAVEIKHIDKLFRQTIKIYNNAISYCIKVFAENWSDLRMLEVGNKERFAYADSLIHNTSTSIACYDFDSKFPKLPSYLRFAVINTSLGYLASYHSNLDNWHKNGCKGKEPVLSLCLNKLPVFYKGNMYKGEYTKDEVLLKLFVNNDWNWISVQLKHTDVLSIEKKIKKIGKMSVPMLEHKNKKWFLRFAFDTNVKLNTIPVSKQKILAIDLGINTDATCSVMISDGAILARKSINFASDKDHIFHALNKIKKIQQKFGYCNTDKLWRDVKFHNDELARKIAINIVDFAKQNNCSVIVFEHLDMQGKKKGRAKQKLHMWKKNTIQTIVEHKAHLNSIRISRICAWNTSKLAFDGSGEVIRGKDAGFNNNKICKFNNGKVYNCDLSASYNIGARYFIKEKEKSVSVTKWSDIMAKVPECQKRTNCTYATLLKINNIA